MELNIQQVRFNCLSLAPYPILFARQKQQFAMNEYQL